MSIFDRLRGRRAAKQLSCHEVAELVQQFLDGELDETRTPLVEAHLDACRRCGIEASIYRDVITALAHRTDPSPESVRRLHEFGERVAHGDAAGAS